MADNDELQQARENVARLERREELDKKIDKLEQELQDAKSERQNLGKPPAPQAPKP